MTADFRNIYNCIDSNCNTCNNANNSVLDLINFASKLLGLADAIIGERFFHGDGATGTLDGRLRIG